MNLEKLSEKIDASDVVEELLLLAEKVFDKSSNDVKNVIEMLVTKAYFMGKQNAVKTFEE